jgi:cytochrome c oxidase assembly factor 2
MTSSLFATTVVASFFVVALPHVLPCPAPRVAFADGEMPDGSGKRRRRRKPEITETRDGIAQFGSAAGDEELQRSAARTRRECPVPKPGGVVGELLNFNKKKEKDNKQASDDRS